MAAGTLRGSQQDYQTRRGRGNALCKKITTELDARNHSVNLVGVTSLLFIPEIGSVELVEENANHTVNFVSTLLP